MGNGQETQITGSPLVKTILTEYFLDFIVIQLLSYRKLLSMYIPL